MKREKQQFANKSGSDMEFHFKFSFNLGHSKQFTIKAVWL